MIHAHVWNDETNMLAAMTDGKILIWYYPNAVYVDKDLLPRTLFEKDTGYVTLHEIHVITSLPTHFCFNVLTSWYMYFVYCY